ncbi:MAG: TraR/DksA C4-type zinc finger protein [Actinomycetota bacterium]|nr:TraR/DksA C4-type zinc finger protein [Actinomycetota bacterium]
MTDATLADIRASLEEERDKLVRQLSELGEGPEGSLAFDQNFADSSQVTAERAEVEALVGSLKESLDDVEHALAKFEAGTYGLCETCGQPIPPPRLEAKPAARFCIEHAGRR